MSAVSNPQRTPKVVSERHQPRRTMRYSLIATGLCAAAWAVWHFTFGTGNPVRSESRVVLRVSKELLDDLTQDEIREQAAFDLEIMEVRFTGNGDIVGRATIDLDVSEQSSTFVVQVEGTATSEYTGDQQVVILDGAGHGEFRGTKQIVFDGRTYRAEPARAEATHESEIVDIRPKSGSLLRGPVRLIASREARRVRPEFDAAAAREIEMEVTATLDEIVNDLVGELNESTRLEETLARLHDTPSWTIQLSSTEEYLQAAVVPEGRDVPMLPRPTMDAERVPVELWIRVNRPQAVLAGVLVEWNLAHDLLRRSLDENLAAQLSEDVIIERVGDWIVVGVGSDADSAM